MVMDWIDGPDLKHWLKQGGRPTYAQIWVLYEPILDAIAFAHEQGIIHRDLKPENILMCKYGDRWIPKITDFGIAKDAQSATLTQTGAVMGTALYMSPEQAKGASQVDLRSDLYSLGVMLFELLVGRVPFLGDTPTAVLFAHITEPVPSMSSMGAEVAPALESFVQRALAKDPAQRFPKAQDFALALKPLLLDKEASSPLVFASTKEEAASKSLPSEQSYGVAVSSHPTEAPSHSTGAPSQRRQPTKQSNILLFVAALTCVLLGVLLFFVFLQPAKESAQMETVARRPYAAAQAQKPQDASLIPTKPDVSSVADDKQSHPKPPKQQKKPAPAPACPSTNRSFCQSWRQCMAGKALACKQVSFAYKDKRVRINYRKAMVIHRKRCRRKHPADCQLVGDRGTKPLLIGLMSKAVSSRKEAPVPMWGCSITQGGEGRRRAALWPICIIGRAVAMDTGLHVGFIVWGARRKS